MIRRRRIAGLLGLWLAAISFAAADAQPNPELQGPPSFYESLEQNFREASVKLADPQACSDCRSLSGVFFIDWEMHTGFDLYAAPYDGEQYLPSADGERLIPILDREMAEAFRAALGDANGDPMPGYCECSGWTIEHNGTTYFRIDEARLQSTIR